MIFKIFRYRIYPTKTQEVLLNKHFGCSRWIYNWGLEHKIKSYKENEKYESYFTLTLKLKDLKKEFPWLKEVNSQSLQMSLKHLDCAYTNFFRRKNGFPNFKKKKNRRDSCYFPQHNKINWDQSKIRISKIGWIKSVFHIRFNGKIKMVTVKKTGSNNFFASVLVETDINTLSKKEIKKETSVGIDVGLKSYITTSDGKKIDNPKYLKKLEKKLKYNQYKFSKKLEINKKNKVENSKRREKQRIKVAKIYEKITNKRDDFLHKLTYQLTHDNQVDTLIIEDLSISNLLKNHNLARSISDAAWGKFFGLLKYKCEWYGKNLIEIGRFDPSSKICNKCGIINNSLKLSDREWICECGSINDRDINAAKNIKDFGLHKQNLIGQELPESTLMESVLIKTTMK